MNEILFLQGQAPAGNMTTTLLFFGAMILIFWLFMIRPQAKKQREQRDFSSNLEKGQEVVTSSGIIGKVNKIEDNVITLEVGTKMYIRVTKNAISKEMTDALISEGKEKK